MNKTNEWFINWFDSKYYHILYKDRSQAEANNFIKQLVNNLILDPEKNVLDLGCGKGRHANTLSKFFKTLEGIDISKESIDFANKNKSSNQNFHISDMRDFEMGKSYGYIFNLFTSFGYFENLSDNLKVLNQCNKHLLKDGLLIIDFLNAKKILKSINNSNETKTIDNVNFELNKSIIDNYVVKKIKITDGEKAFNYQEKVQLFDLNNFIEMFKKTGFELISSFCDYNMNSYSEGSSRLILVAKKTNT